jgi:hypothetical protein
LKAIEELADGIILMASADFLDIEDRSRHGTFCRFLGFSRQQRNRSK